MIERPSLQDDVLFTAYRDRIEGELLAAIKEHMEPLVREAAKKATEALAIAIQQHYDVMSKDTIVRVDLRINQEKV